jgi:hypothetical protein
VRSPHIVQSALADGVAQRHLVVKWRTVAQEALQALRSRAAQQARGADAAEPTLAEVAQALGMDCGLLQIDAAADDFLP